ncbi:signal peptidase I [Bacillus massilinigeriensis]|uniref:signal peptidase I n=1 Tax=Bacillus mediterraneensis TaxID=1805474 RepID=UPI0008F95A15|nr:signal peptidase I [Bacillus mediterraneensis]
MTNRLSLALWEWIRVLILAFLLAWIIKNYIFAPYTVKGASMEPTLHHKERIVVNRLVSADNLQRGDIVIIKGDNKNYVKRVIGLPGDHIKMENDQLLINGELKREPYLEENKKAAEEMGLLLTGNLKKVIVPKGHYFVMGDNRIKSMDSRNGLGLIEEDRLVGKCQAVMFPLENLRIVK